MAYEPFGLPFWLDIERPEFPQLNHTTTADVAIVGAGIAGLKLARCLARYGLDVVILEGQRVGEGASGRNQGSLNHGPAMTYADCSKRYSRQTARDLWRMGLENHRLMREQLAELEIDCDYFQGGFYFLARRDASGHDATLAEYRRDFLLLQEDGFEVRWLDAKAATEEGGNPLFTGGLCYVTDAQFHSGKYVTGLARGVSRVPGVRLFEQSRVRRIGEDGTGAFLETAKGRVTARHLFLAVNALAPQFVPQLESGLRAERGQVLTTEPLTIRPCRGSFGTAMAWWREIPERDGRYRLLFGGGRTRDTADSLFRQFDASGRPHPQLEKEGFLPSAEHQRRLDQEFRTLFPSLSQARITHRWGGLQSFTADSLPMIGMFDPARKMHGLAGFCGRGNCFADVGAAYLAGQVAGVVSEVERNFGSLFTQHLAAGRPEANWEPWITTND